MSTANLQQRPARGIGTARLVASILLLVASVGLAAHTVRHARESTTVNPVPALSPIADERERQARQHDVLGTFATGSEPGDRLIVVLPEGRLEFRLVGNSLPAYATKDRYTLQMHGRRVCLATSTSGYIDAIDIDHLEYSGDTYERVRKGGREEGSEGVRE